MTPDALTGGAVQFVVSPQAVAIAFTLADLPAPPGVLDLLNRASAGELTVDPGHVEQELRHSGLLSAAADAPVVLTDVAMELLAICAGATRVTTIQSTATTSLSVYMLEERSAVVMPTDGGVSLGLLADIAARDRMLLDRVGEDQACEDGRVFDALLSPDQFADLTALLGRHLPAEIEAFGARLEWPQPLCSTLGAVLSEEAAWGAAVTIRPRLVDTATSRFRPSAHGAWLLRTVVQGETTHIQLSWRRHADIVAYLLTLDVM